MERGKAACRVEQRRIIRSPIQRQQFVAGRNVIFERLRAAAPQPRAEKSANKCFILSIVRDGRGLHESSNSDTFTEAPRAKRVYEKMACRAANLVDHAIHSNSSMPASSDSLARKICRRSASIT